MWSLPRNTEMELREKVHFEIEKQMIPFPLPEELILYALDTAHIVLAVQPVQNYEEKALYKEKIRISTRNDIIYLELPRRIYEFYRLDEADYTVMASEIVPKTVEILF